MPLHISFIDPFIPAKVWLRFRAFSCGICSGQSGTGFFDFLQLVSFYHCPILVHSFILSSPTDFYIILAINNIIEDHTWKLIAIPFGGYTAAVKVNSMVLQSQYHLTITCTFNVVTFGCQAVFVQTFIKDKHFRLVDVCWRDLQGNAIVDRKAEILCGTVLISHGTHPVTLVQPCQLPIGLMFQIDTTDSRKILCQSKVFIYEKFQLCQPHSL
jgi:hypothetical protein